LALDGRLTFGELTGKVEVWIAHVFGGGCKEKDSNTQAEFLRI